MTIKPPQRSIADKLLHILGKKRGVLIIDEFSAQLGPYYTAIARKENFFKALLRPRGNDLPAGMVDINKYFISWKGET